MVTSLSLMVVGWDDERTGTIAPKAQHISSDDHINAAFSFIYGDRLNLSVTAMAEVRAEVDSQQKGSRFRSRRKLSAAIAFISEES
jgi:hypothetical protein